MGRCTCKVCTHNRVDPLKVQVPRVHGDEEKIRRVLHSLSSLKVFSAGGAAGWRAVSHTEY